MCLLAVIVTILDFLRIFHYIAIIVRNSNVLC